MTARNKSGELRRIRIAFSEAMFAGRGALELAKIDSRAERIAAFGKCPGPRKPPEACAAPSSAATLSPLQARLQREKQAVADVDAAVITVGEVLACEVEAVEKIPARQVHEHILQQRSL